MNIAKLFAKSYDWEYRNKKDDIPFYLQLAGQYGDPILDVGCGTGRITNVLAAKRFQIVGIDIDAEALALAREKIRDARDEENCSFVRADITECARISQFRSTVFRTILFPFDVFSYLGVSRANADRRQAIVQHRIVQHRSEQIVLQTQRAVLRWAKCHIHPDGIIAMDIFTEKLVVRDDRWRHHYTRLHRGLGRITCSSSFCQKKDSRFFDLCFILEIEESSGRIRRLHRTLYGYQISAVGLQELLHEVGFETIAVYDNQEYGECEIGDEHEGIVIVARPQKHRG